MSERSVIKAILIFLIFPLLVSRTLMVHSVEPARQTECMFVGEIVHVKYPDSIMLYRRGFPNKRIKVVAHTRLYAGDVIWALHGKSVYIRDKPFAKRPRLITPDQGKVYIDEVTKCNLTREWSEPLEGIQRLLSSLLSKPIAPRPKVTHPRGADELKLESELVPALDLQVPQYLTNELNEIAVTWSGPGARISLISADNHTDVLAFENSEFFRDSYMSLKRSLKAEEKVILVLESGNGTNSYPINVVESSIAPLPKGIDKDLILSSEEKAIYAMWMVFEGPPQWKLYGLTLLREAALDNYMAWKIWRGIISGDV